jgi:serine/threonine protein phosphatase 1
MRPPIAAQMIEVDRFGAYVRRQPRLFSIAPMLSVRSLFNFGSWSQPRTCAIPRGLRIYAIGDIHGRLDLLDDLLAMIDADDRGRGGARTQLIFLGDLIDRGPDSRGVVERLMALASASTPRFLMGNHEEVFLRALAGDLKALRFLIRIGGRETLISYGISREDYRDLDYDELMARVQSCVPAAHRQFLASFENWIEVGDYLFVHAGLRPGIAVEDQSKSDLCWIREDFLSHRDSFGKMVVHGHSITEEIDERPNRIGIDTGAFATGRLTAIGLQGDERWYLST